MQRGNSFGSAISNRMSDLTLSSGKDGRSSGGKGKKEKEEGEKKKGLFKRKW